LRAKGGYSGFGAQVTNPVTSGGGHDAAPKVAEAINETATTAATTHGRIGLTRKR